MDEGTIKLLVYAIGILAAVIGMLASIYRIRESKLRIRTHGRGGDVSRAPETPSEGSAPVGTSRGELKALKKIAKQRSKLIKKSGGTS